VVAPSEAPILSLLHGRHTEEDTTVGHGPEAFDDPGIVTLWDGNGRQLPGGVAYRDDTH